MLEGKGAPVSDGTPDQREQGLLFTGLLHNPPLPEMSTCASGDFVPPCLFTED